MSIINNTTPPTKEAIFRADLATLPLHERARRIEEKVRETRAALGSRDEKLLSLRSVFDRLTLDFWNTFARGLDCENPAKTIAHEQARLRSVGYLGTILLALTVTVWLVAVLQSGGYTGLAMCVGAMGVIGICFHIAVPLKLIADAREVSAILRREQQPFWLTGGAGIGLSNLGITVPSEARWWWPDRIAFVFIHHGIAARFSVDAFKCELIWQNDWEHTRDSALKTQRAAEILRHLLATTPAYRQLVNSFGALAGLENELAFLGDLKIEIDHETAKEQRKAQPQTPLTPAPESRQARSAQADQQNTRDPNKNASWETLIIPKSLRENLQAYVRILRDYEAYRAAGVHLPKGLLLFGPPGCGKTQIAKTLSNEGGLNFVSLSTSDCKQKFIGWSAEKLSSVFAEARAKQPSLIFIDELDAVTPPRGMYQDCIAQEATAQLLQEIDGIGSDGQAVFICAATNRPDHVDSAMLSRFAERIEIPLPDERARRALLEVFLGTMRFTGDRHHIIESLAKATEGKSGRDLRALVNQAVLSAVKRTNSPKDFALCAADFERTSPATTTTTERIPHLQVDPRIRGTSFQLDPQVRDDSVAALMSLGFPKRQAQSRVDAVTTGSSAEDIIKAALRGGHCVSK